MAATVPMSFGIDPMFVVLPTGDDFIKDDAQWFGDLEFAYNSALDWSVELNGQCVNVYEHHGGKYIQVAKVWA